MTESKNKVTNLVGDVSENSFPIGIFVTGITGSGKSTLVNVVFGEPVAATYANDTAPGCIKEYVKKDSLLRIMETEGLELDSNRAQDSIKIKNLLSTKSKSSDPSDRIHVIWYCHPATDRRFPETEFEFLQELSSLGIPMVFVMTQCTDADSRIEEFKQTINAILTEAGMHDIAIIPVLAQPFETRWGVIPAFGLEELMEETFSKLPNSIK